MSELKSQSSQGRRNRSIRIVAAILTIAAALLLFVQRQFVYDQLAVWQYEPSSEISNIVDRTEMTEKGQFYFYASRPSIEDSESFKRLCTGSEPGTAILGCYNGIHIYIYDIDNTKLDGIKEVTAAHEMLHAAYDRLSSSERDRINDLLGKQYRAPEMSPKFKERMSYYERNETSDFNNELHSIIATEVKDIHPELEEYFKRYFDDRQKIVALHDSYESVFTQLEERGEQIVKELNSLQASINSGSSRYNNEVAQLNEAIDSFNNRARNNGFQTQSQFQSERGVLIARAADLEVLRRTISDELERYKELEAEYKRVALQTEELNRSINSSLAPAPSI